MKTNNPNIQKYHTFMNEIREIEGVSFNISGKATNDVDYADISNGHVIYGINGVEYKLGLLIFLRQDERFEYWEACYQEAANKDPKKKKHFSNYLETKSKVENIAMELGFDVMNK